MIFKQWIKQTYGVDANDSNARFTVYNMEVAYAAGQQEHGWCYIEYIAGYGAEVHTLPEGRITHWKYLEEPACSTEHTEVTQ